MLFQRLNVIGMCRVKLVSAGRLAKSEILGAQFETLFPALLSMLVRNRHRRILAFLLFGFIAKTCILAQSMNLGITHHVWGLEDGLPDRVIQAIAQTPDGYLWLGTPHGLVRFDGFKFVNFGTAVA